MDRGEPRISLPLAEERDADSQNFENTIPRPKFVRFTRISKRRLVNIKSRLASKANYSSSLPTARKQYSLRKMRQQKLLALQQMAKARRKTISELLVDFAVCGLTTRHPEFSASSVVTRAQKYTFISVAVIAILVTLIHWQLALALLGVVLSVFYLGSSLLRLLLLLDVEEEPKPQTLELEKLEKSGQCGTYSILVALYKESNQIDALIDALCRLKWPKDQLEVFLICEADDQETLAKLAGKKLPPHFLMLTVPNRMPKTKPKALNYALYLASGDQLVIYDAEDRPHPWQLLEARQAFLTGEKGLACVQAPLQIHNYRTNWLTQLFAIEYMTLFSGILPVLARWGAPIPLGGTSNHFNTSILKNIGGWDPYNVTEDADLGIRLYRAGYQCGTITLPTLEEAPSTFGNWLRQRTRWLKGWMQTVLVHLRNPKRAAQQMGMVGTSVFLFVLVAIIVSALVHPFLMIASALYLPEIILEGHWQDHPGIATIGLFNLFAGYLTYLFLAMMICNKMERRRSKIWILFLPFYWLGISLAAWRAFFQLFGDPFLWEKTDHVLKHEPKQEYNSAKTAQSRPVTSA